MISPLYFFIVHFVNEAIFLTYENLCLPFVKENNSVLPIQDHSSKPPPFFWLAAANVCQCDLLCSGLKAEGHGFGVILWLKYPSQTRQNRMR